MNEHLFSHVRGGHTFGREMALNAATHKYGLPLDAFLIVEVSDENTGRRYGLAKCRRGWAVKLGSGGRNRGETGYQIWAVVKMEYRR